MYKKKIVQDVGTNPRTGRNMQRSFDWQSLCVFHPIWASVLKVDSLRGGLTEGNRIFEKSAFSNNPFVAPGMGLGDHL